MLLTQQHGEGSLCLAPLGVYNKKEKKKKQKKRVATLAQQVIKKT